MRMSQCKSPLTVILALAIISAGCGKPSASPQPPVAPVSPAPPPVVVPQQPEPARRPEPWTGPGLATPYINDKGELELVYGDNRGTVKLGGDKGTVDRVALAPDRQQLVYAVDSERIYYVSIVSGQLRERELAEAADYWPVGRLAWSPCSQYLMVDAGSSATRGLLVLKPSTGEIVGSCDALDFAWSPAVPSRLAIGLFSDIPLIPQTELDRTADLVVVDLPSGRMTTLASGGAADFWGVREWTAEQGLVAHHTFIQADGYRDVVKRIDVPAPPASADDGASPSGPLQSGVPIALEVDFRGQLLLVDSRRVPLRQVTDAHDGRVLDATMTADGSLIAYAWLAKGEEIVRIRTVTCPDLAAGEIPLALSDFERHTSEYGCGPNQLEFAPGSGRILLERYFNCGGDDRVQVYDLNSGKLLVDRYLWMPLWVPDTDGAPRLVAGALLRKSTPSDPVGAGNEQSLIVLDVMSRAQTIIKQGTKSESWRPIGFLDPVHVICLLNTTQLGSWKATEVTVGLPE